MADLRLNRPAVLNAVDLESARLLSNAVMEAERSPAAGGDIKRPRYACSFRWRRAAVFRGR
jgi:enoyl-CoA hydratase/carnithine racemase